MNITNIIESLGAIGIGAAVIAYIVRKLFTQLLDRDLEKFKSELRTTAFEREVRFSKLHERRAEVIAELYKLLVKTHAAFESLIKPFHFSNEPKQSESIEIAKKCGETFINYYTENKIYFNSTICKEIDDFNSNLIDAWTKYLTINSDGYRIDQEGIKQWRDSWNTIREKVPIIRSRIETPAIHARTTTGFGHIAQ